MRPSVAFVLTTLLLGCLPTGLRAQTAITNWVLSSSDAANASAYTSPGPITFQNTSYAVTAFSTATASGFVDAAATAAYVRRSGTANNNSSVYEVQNGSDTNVMGLNTSTLNASSVLLQNNILMGLNDVFTNTNGNPVQANTNIERVDYYWAGGFVVNSSTAEGFAVFDRNNGTADSFQIAVITGWSTGLNQPTTYGGNVVEATSANYGGLLDWDPTTAGAQTTFPNWSTLRFAGNGDSLATLSVLNTGTPDSQGVSGVYVTMASLGIAAGTRVYGYSVMATDVTNTVGSLADWKNATFYPTNTDDTVGSIDLISGGRRIVPEPQTYGLALMTAMLAVTSGRRWWNGRRTAKSGCVGS